MAVTIESATTGTAVVATSITFSHTCTAATALFVGVGCDNSNTVTSVTYNGTALDKLWGLNAGAGIGHAGGWLMVSPATGAHNVVASFASCSANAGAVGFLGTVTTSVAAAHRTVYTASDQTGGPSVTVVDSQNGDVLVDSAVTYGSTITVGGGQTSRCEDDALAGGSTSWGVSTETASGASTVMSWTTGDFNATGATALIASGGGGALVKTVNGLALASMKTRNGLAAASVKTINGLASV